MNSTLLIATTILLLIVAYQAWITVRLIGAVEYSCSQKAYQFALIWIIPVLGAVVVHFVLSSTALPITSTDRAFIKQDENYPDYPPFVGHDH